MKYWKQFWGGLNQGWKRIHYLVFVVPSVIIGIPSLLLEAFGPNRMNGIMGGFVYSLLYMLSYWLLITIIYWIKEGFQSKEPTEEE